ncbi:MAG TPA: hypothetical protein VFQ92_11715 [Blastocatellia bacterium]|nr:hypothetical protein [Blastocatellia bacterium]
MPSSKPRVTKRGQPRGLPQDVERLIELIISEVQSPVDMQRLLERMPATTNCSDEATEFLKAKDRFQRREAFIKNEALWYNKYGWFMARIVGLFGLMVIVLALLTRGAGADFIIFAIMGAGGYYLLVVTLSNFRYRDKNRKRMKLLERESDRYQREIVPIASKLLKRFDIDPRRYPVASPRSRAGLEENQHGIFIPVD